MNNAMKAICVEAIGKQRVNTFECMLLHLIKEKYTDHLKAYSCQI